MKPVHITESLSHHELDKAEWLKDRMRQEMDRKFPHGPIHYLETPNDRTRTLLVTAWTYAKEPVQ